MPNALVVDYYERVEDTFMPLLTGRRVALRQVFDGQMIFRRHGAAGRWIYISGRSALLH